MKQPRSVESDIRGPTLGYECGVGDARRGCAIQVKA